MHLATSLLRSAGFTDVRTGVANNVHSVPEFTSYNLIVNTDEEMASCHPFGSEYAICREAEGIVAERSPNPSDLSYAADNRQAIKEAVIRFAALDPDMPGI